MRRRRCGDCVNRKIMRYYGCGLAKIFEDRCLKDNRYFELREIPTVQEKKTEEKNMKVNGNTLEEQIAEYKKNKAEEKEENLDEVFEEFKKMKEKKESSVAEPLNMHGVLTFNGYTKDALADINNAIEALEKLNNGAFKSLLTFVDLEVVDLISNVDYSEMAQRLKHVRDLVFGSVINWELVRELLGKVEI